MHPKLRWRAQGEEPPYSAFGAQHTPATAWRKLTQRDSRRVGFTADAGRVPPAARHAGPVAPGTARSDASTPAAGVTNPQRHAPEPRLGRTPCRPLTAYLPRLKQPTWAASI